MLLLTLALAANLSPEPIDIDKWLDPALDYPLQARIKEQEGDVKYRLSVGIDGRPTGCTIVTSSGAPLLDKATCSNLKRRARFRPATDAAGNPISGDVTRWASWALQRDRPRPNAGHAVHVEFDELGEVSRCEIRAMAPDGWFSAWERDKCETQGNAKTFAALLGRSTTGLRNAEIRTFSRSGALASVDLQADLRRVVLEAEFDRTRTGEVSRCKSLFPPRGPEPDPQDIDACEAADIRPTVAPTEGTPVTTLRLIVDVVATRR